MVCVRARVLRAHQLRIPEASAHALSRSLHQIGRFYIIRTGAEGKKRGKVGANYTTASIVEKGHATPASYFGLWRNKRVRKLQPLAAEAVA